MAYTYDN